MQCLIAHKRCTNDRSGASISAAERPAYSPPIQTQPLQFRSVPIDVLGHERSYYLMLCLCLGTSDREHLDVTSQVRSGITHGVRRDGDERLIHT
jgi:hypothetical protein